MPSHELSSNIEKNTYGLFGSKDSHVTTYRSMLYPQPFRRDRCTSAEPSSRFNGRPTKLSPPFSALSQKSSSTCDWWSTGAFVEPDKLTPRKRTVLPALSTKLVSIVCKKLGPTGFPVVGDTEGTLGMTSRVKDFYEDVRN